MEFRKITKEDVASILENHKVWLEDSSKGKQADLSNLNLSSGIGNYDDDLRFINFKGSTLKYIKGRDLSGCNLEGADLSFADLTDTIFEGANLSYATLKYVSGDYADFSNANLSNAILQSSHFVFAKFTNANLFQASFGRTDLSYSVMVNADLRRSNADYSTIHTVNLTGAILNEYMLNSGYIQVTIDSDVITYCKQDDIVFSRLLTPSKCHTTENNLETLERTVKSKYKRGGTAPDTKKYAMYKDILSLLKREKARQIKEEKENG